MSRSLSLLLGTAILAFSIAPASAKECQGVAFPDRIQVAATPLTLNGLGLRQATLLRVNVYVAALYLASRSTDANAILGSTTPKRLILHFVRGVDAAELQQAWEEGFANNAKEQLPALQPRVEKLKGWMTDIKSGEQLTFTHRPGAGIEVDVNGTVKGTVEGDDFARAFYSIWLGSRPPNAGLKAGVLGGPCA